MDCLKGYFESGGKNVANVSKLQELFCDLPPIPNSSQRRKIIDSFCAGDHV